MASAHLVLLHHVSFCFGGPCILIVAASAGLAGGLTRRRLMIDWNVLLHDLLSRDEQRVDYVLANHADAGEVAGP